MSHNIIWSFMIDIEDIFFNEKRIMEDLELERYIDNMIMEMLMWIIFD